MNSEKEIDRLTSLKIIQKRYSFLFEDVWFILIQYMYFEKFIVCNTTYLESKAGTVWLEKYDWIDRMFGSWVAQFILIMKMFGFMFFNLIFTALIGLGGLTTIPYCFKMIKRGQTKTKIYYILTFIQIILQTTFPFLRVGIVSLHVFLFRRVPPKDCISVGFQIKSIQYFGRNRIKNVEIII